MNSEPTAKPGAQHLLAYVRFELQGLLRAAVRAFLWTALPLALLFFVMGFSETLTATDSPNVQGVVDAVFMIAIVLSISLLCAPARAHVSEVALRPGSGPGPAHPVT